MQVCFFSAQYLPTIGGVERYTYNLAKRLIAAGHQVLVVTSLKPGLAQRETDPSGIRILRVPCYLAMNGRFPFPYPGALKELEKESIDFAVIQTRFYPLSFDASWFCQKEKIPAIVVDHSTGHMPMGNPILNFAGGLYEHFAAWYIKRRVNGFYGVSLAVNQWLTHFGIKAKGCLHNAVDPEELEKTSSQKDWRAELGLTPDTRLVAFVGRIIPEKGVEPLARAFGALNRQDARLLVAGEGPQLEQLKALGLPGVIFLGAVPYPDVLALLRQTDLYCLPTTYAEGFPTTFLEAAACGCPILSTVTGGSKELMPTPDYGIQLEDTNPETWKKALAEALDNESWRKEASRLCRANLDAHFTWDRVAGELLTILQSSER